MESMNHYNTTAENSLLIDNHLLFFCVIKSIYHHDFSVFMLHPMYHILLRSFNCLPTINGKVDWILVVFHYFRFIRAKCTIFCIGDDIFRITRYSRLNFYRNQTALRSFQQIMTIIHTGKMDKETEIMHTISYGNQVTYNTTCSNGIKTDVKYIYKNASISD